jgi:hypothetical protein
MLTVRRGWFEALMMRCSLKVLKRWQLWKALFQTIEAEKNGEPMDV